MRDITRIAEDTYDKYMGKSEHAVQQQPDEPEKKAEPSTYLLGVDYDEFKPETYRGVTLTHNSEEVKRWYGKGFNQDWVEATNYCGEEKLSPVMLLGSVHSYNQDVAQRK